MSAPGPSLRQLTAASGRRLDPHILVVDDDVDLRILIRDAIELAEEHRDEEASPTISECGSGEEALTFLDSCDPLPSLIYMDVEMPGMGGLEAVKRLKENPRTRNIPVVILSGLQDVAQQGRDAGCEADAFQVKPADADSLIETVLQSTDYWLHVRPQKETTSPIPNAA
ncbi:MAG: response regulator [Planctomycetota bacterium]